MIFFEKGGVMNKFQRARSAEQKDIRISEITDAAIKLYNNMPYEKITLAGIAKELSFTRANLYKYVSSKEEIFLNVIERDIKEWIKDLTVSFGEKKDVLLQEFALIWAQSLYRYKRLIEMFSILYSIIEKNVSVEKLAAFKCGFMGEFNEVFHLINTLLPTLSLNDASKFLQMQLYFVMGLYPATIESDIQRKAIEMAGISYTPPDFVEMFSSFIVMIIDGLGKQK